MLLYCCRACGRWTDVSLIKSMNDMVAVIARAMKQPPPEQPGYPCPAGHGLMEQIQPTERIYVRSGEVEALVEQVFEQH